jgi:hypothetical protein
MDLPTPFRYHFFVSYTTREDEVRAILPYLDEFVKELERYGFTTKPLLWLDRIEIGQLKNVTDEHVRRTLANAINECTALIAFVSPGYAASDFCRFEWSHIGVTSPYDHCFSAPLIWKQPQFPQLFGPGSWPGAFSLWEAFERHNKRIECNNIASEFRNIIGQAADFLHDCHDWRWSRWQYLQECLPAFRWHRDN